MSTHQEISLARSMRIFLFTRSPNERHFNGKSLTWKKWDSFCSSREAHGFPSRICLRCLLQHSFFWWKYLDRSICKDGSEQENTYLGHIHLLIRFDGNLFLNDDSYIQTSWWGKRDFPPLSVTYPWRKLDHVLRFVINHSGARDKTAAGLHAASGPLVGR